MHQRPRVVRPPSSLASQSGGGTNVPDEVYVFFVYARVFVRLRENSFDSADGN